MIARKSQKFFKPLRYVIAGATLSGASVYLIGIIISAIGYFIARERKRMKIRLIHCQEGLNKIACFDFETRASETWLYFLSSLRCHPQCAPTIHLIMQKKVALLPPYLCLFLVVLNPEF
jgi:hypothetical protein